MSASQAAMMNLIAVNWGTCTLSLLQKAQRRAPFEFDVNLTQPHWAMKT
jgi:hypothetical protein